MRDNSQQGDGFNGGLDGYGAGKTSFEKGKDSTMRRKEIGSDYAASVRGGVTQAGFINPVDQLDATRPFFVKIGSGGLLEALEKLDHQLMDVSLIPCRARSSISCRGPPFQAGHHHILSKKEPVSWTGREITLGQIGLVNHGGLPTVLTKPGRYPGFPLKNWWARSFEDTKDSAYQSIGL